MNPIHFRELVIRPALDFLGAPYDSEAATNLLLGTAVVESGLRFLTQHGGGPALGVYQIEPATHDDMYSSFLDYRGDLKTKVMRRATDAPLEEQLVTNLTYATIIARLKYWRAPAPLPAADDLAGLADYWKRHFNSMAGAGRTEKFIAAYRKHILKQP